MAAEHYKKDEREIGALWTKQSRKGEFLSGTIELDGRKIDVVVFPVDSAKRRSDKSPTHRVLKDRPREEWAGRGGGDGYGQRSYQRQDPPVATERETIDDAEPSW